jgi:DNA-binding transcriptional MerR regulator
VTVTPDGEELLMLPEVAALFRVTTRQVQLWARSGLIPREAVIWTPGGQRRYRAAVIRELLARTEQRGAR